MPGVRISFLTSVLQLTVSGLPYRPVNIWGAWFLQKKPHCMAFVHFLNRYSGFSANVRRD